MDGVSWSADTASSSSKKEAEVITLQSKYTQVKVTNSKFYCLNSPYVATKILKFD